MFHKWCFKAGVISFQCSVDAILTFLKELLDKNESFSTVKVVCLAEFRKMEQLFVYCVTSHLGKPLTKQQLSHWIVAAIPLEAAE